MYMLVELSQGQTLRDSVLSLGVTKLKESEVKKCMHQLLLIVQ